MPATAHDAPVVHLARPHRPVLVAGTLGELTGPQRGLVELPLRLWWNPQHTFDLDRPTMLAWMYENVLREAIRVEELRSYLHGPTLLRIWPELNLPRGVRAAWEARHPRLRHAAHRTATTAAPIPTAGGPAAHGLTAPANGPAPRGSATAVPGPATRQPATTPNAPVTRGSAVAAPQSAAPRSAATARAATVAASVR